MEGWLRHMYLKLRGTDGAARRRWGEQMAAAATLIAQIRRFADNDFPRLVPEPQMLSAYIVSCILLTSVYY